MILYNDHTLLSRRDRSLHESLGNVKSSNFMDWQELGMLRKDIMNTFKKVTFSYSKTF